MGNYATVLIILQWKKGLKQGSQKKRGGSRNARYAEAGGLDHSIETSFPALSHRTISFQHFTK